MMVIKYLSTRWQAIVCGLSMLGIFTLVLLLDHVRLPIVLYGLALSLFVGGCFFTIGFWRFYTTYRALENRAAQLPHASFKNVRVQGEIEKSYQHIIEALQEDNKALLASHEQANHDMIEYYTLWVHQIKTPIAALDLLLQHSQSKERAAFRMELMQIEEYVEMVLQYVRLGCGYSDFAFRRQRLTPILHEVAKKYATVFINKKISLKIEATEIEVLTDEKWLAFILSQLLSNALKYTPQGSITFRMVNHQLQIIDTGIGIRAEDLPRVFEQGFTGANGRAYKKSSGIGLYLCKKIADQLGHDLTITSEVGKGTTVMLDLSYKNVRME